MSDIKALVRSWVNSNEEFSVDFDLLWQGLGYTRKDNALVAMKNAALVEGQDFRVFLRNQENLGGRPTKQYFLSIDSAKAFCMMAPTSAGKQVRSYFLECERELKAILQTKQKPSMSFNDALKLAHEALGRQMHFYRNTEDKPGLRKIVDFFSEPHTLDAPKAGVEAITKFHFNVELSQGELNSLGRTCATTYRTWHNAEPERELDYHNGSTAPYPVCVYGTEMYSTIENWLINKGYSV